jgi:hypothetical protein
VRKPSTGDTPANGDVDISTNIFHPIINDVGRYTYWAAFTNEHCVSERVDMEVIRQGIDLVGGNSPSLLTVCDETILRGPTVSFEVGATLYQ